MKLIVTENYEDLSQLTADIVAGYMVQDRRINLSLTSGSSPVRMYELLNEKIRKMGDLSNVYYYTFDETPVKNPEGKVIGYDNFDGLNKVFFEKNKINNNNIKAINEKNYKKFNNEIETDGGLDLMVIGMGEDGHFCANMPGSTIYDEDVYRVNLSDIKDSWNTDYQKSLGENYSDFMYTLGFSSLIKVNHIVLIINGIHKAKAVQKAFQQPINEVFPASYLRLLPNLTVIVDKDAAQLLEK